MWKAVIITFFSKFMHNKLHSQLYQATWTQFQGTQSYWKYLCPTTSSSTETAATCNWEELEFNLSHNKKSSSMNSSSSQAQSKNSWFSKLQIKLRARSLMICWYRLHPGATLVFFHMHRWKGLDARKCQIHKNPKQASI